MIVMSAEILESPLVFAALMWTRNFGTWADKLDERKNKELRRAFVEEGELVIHASRYDSAHPLGPVITINGPRGGLDIIVPWHQVRSIIVDSRGKLDLGFHQLRTVEKRVTESKA